MFPLFPLGQVVATPGALAALERAKQSVAFFLDRITGARSLGSVHNLHPHALACYDQRRSRP